MDFDDLDDAIEERMKEVEKGDTSQLTDAELALLASNRVTKKYEPTSYMPPCERSKKIPGLLEHSADIQYKIKTFLRGKIPTPEICLRAFLFHGPGEQAKEYLLIASSLPTWMELIVHESPGRGLREGEPIASDLAALSDDAYDAVKPALQEMGMGGSLEGAPFAFIGMSVGAQVMMEVAKKAKRELFLEPQTIIVVERGAPHVPLLSEKGKSLLGDVPEFMKAHRSDVYDVAMGMPKPVGEKLLKTWVEDIKYSCDVQEQGFHSSAPIIVIKAAHDAKAQELVKTNTSWKEVSLSLSATGEVFRLPVTSTTTVAEVKKAISSVFGGESGSVVIEKTGGGKLEDSDCVCDKATVSGLQSFKNPRHSWPHPIAIIGCGYNAIKNAMEFTRTGFENFVLFDRNDDVGGYCWITAANKHSKLQTEFGSFHINWGPEFASTGKCGGTDGRAYKSWDTWFKKPQVLENMRVAAAEYGVLPHCHLSTNVSDIDIHGSLQDEERYYELSVDALKDTSKSFKTKASVMLCFPGSMMRNRIIDYPGEAEFDGQIGYGMGDEFIYDDGRLSGTNVAILGNGAFAVENVRTCIEFGTKKVFLVTRRKNLASPRVPCWFVHQGPIPTPGYMVLQMFEPMYELSRNGSPWDYWAVHSNKTRTNVTIMQNSRFGIGDITFLCLIYGTLEYVEDTVKRVSKHTLHLTSGKKLENVTGIIKALGLLGDHGVDKMHKMTEMVGKFPSGDWRRYLTIDATGMNAANFTTFSLGINVASMARQLSYMYFYPHGMRNALKAGLMEALPRNKARLNEDKPAYVSEVKYDMSSAMILGGFIPESMTGVDEHELYKHAMYHTYHKTDSFLQECQADWDKYQKHFKEVQGIERAYVPYPYTKKMVEGFFEDYSRHVGWKISAEGPDKGSFERTISQALTSIDGLKRNMIPILLKDALACHKDGSTDELWRVAAAKGSYELRAAITASAADSAMDFDNTAYEQWSEWTSKEARVVDLETSKKTINQDQKLWELITEELSKVKAPPPS